MLQTQKEVSWVCQGINGQFALKAAGFEHHEYNRRLTEQFIYGLDAEVKAGEILKELTALKGCHWGNKQPSINGGPESGGSEGAERRDWQYMRGQGILPC